MIISLLIVGAVIKGAQAGFYKLYHRGNFNEMK